MQQPNTFTKKQSLDSVALWYWFYGDLRAGPVSRAGWTGFYAAAHSCTLKFVYISAVQLLLCSEHFASTKLCPHHAQTCIETRLILNTRIAHNWDSHAIKSDCWLDEKNEKMRQFRRGCCQLRSSQTPSGRLVYQPDYYHPCWKTVYWWEKQGLAKTKQSWAKQKLIGRNVNKPSGITVRNQATALFSLPMRLGQHVQPSPVLNRVYYFSGLISSLLRFPTN